MSGSWRCNMLAQGVSRQRRSSSLALNDTVTRRVLQITWQHDLYGIRVGVVCLRLIEGRDEQTLQHRPG